MNITSTIKSWARDNNFRVTRFNQDHSLDSRYPDSVPTLHLEATLETGAKGCPHLRIWIPLARRTPLFAFGPDAAKPEETDVDATFPSFDNANELVAALNTVHQDFLGHYGAQQPSVAYSLS